MPREISAGIIIYRKTHEEIKFLLLYHGGAYWNFPKGKLETEEGSFKAALREVREETGLGGKDLRFKELFKVYDKYVFQRTKEKIFKLVIYYLAETHNPNIRISSEHDGWGWFSHKEAMKLLKFRNSQINLTRAYDLLQGKSIASGAPHTARRDDRLQGSVAPRRQSSSLPGSRQYFKPKPRP